MWQDNSFFNFQRIGALVFIYLVLISISCADPEEGCIDVLARNFDLEADLDCCLVEEECCCTYPSLRLNLFYKGTATDTLGQAATNIRLDQYYPLENLTDSVRIDSFSLFISNLQIISNTEADTLQLIESLELSFIDAEGEEQSSSFQDNIALVSMPAFSVDIGTYRSDISFDEVLFDIGLRPALASIDPTSVDNNHPLGGEYTVLFDSTTMRFLTGRIGFTLKNGEMEQVYAQNLDPFKSDSEQFLSPISINKGENLDILMRINVLDIFKGIIFDIPSDDAALILNENLTSSISVLE